MRVFIFALVMFFCSTASAMPYYYSIGENITTNAEAKKAFPYTQILTNTVRALYNENDDMILGVTAVYDDGWYDANHPIQKTLDIFFKFVYNSDSDEKRMFYTTEDMDVWVELKNENKYTNMYTTAGEIAFQVYFNEEFFGNQVLYPYGNDYVVMY